jgi:pyruvate dehydrogenase E1 component alpha subunit
MSRVASFEIEYRQYLDPDGKPTKKRLPAFCKKGDELAEFYKNMLRTRIFDTKAIALQRTGKLGTYASCLGHEAIHTAIGTSMKHEDAFFPMYREYGAQFIRGVKMEEVLMYWGGDERGNDFSGPKHDFPWAVPIATQCLHAAGAAMAFHLRDEKRVAVTVVGDGGSSKADFLEALNAASAWNLPAVFVIVNNQWAISVPRSKQNTAPTLAQKGIGAGLHSIQVDGNDALACKHVMDEAMERARKREGATCIEAVTYRLHDHTTADDATRYRPKDEVEDAWAREPIKRLRSYLESINAWDEDKEQAWKTACEKEVAKAVDVYWNVPKPAASDMFDYLYANMPEDLKRQREFALKQKEVSHG